MKVTLEDVLKACVQNEREEYGLWKYTDEELMPKDLEHIGMGYTHIDNEDLDLYDVPVQVELDVVHCEVRRYLGSDIDTGLLVETESLKDLERVLEWIEWYDFADVTAVGEEGWRKYYKLEKGDGE